MKEDDKLLLRWFALCTVGAFIGATVQRWL